MPSTVAELKSSSSKGMVVIAAPLLVRSSTKESKPVFHLAKASMHLWKHEQACHSGDTNGRSELALIFSSSLSSTACTSLRLVCSTDIAEAVARVAGKMLVCSATSGGCACQAETGLIIASA